MKKGFLQISFAWLFAIISGIVILFLAIYLSTKIINTEQTTSDAETAKEIGILLNPLETSFESQKTTSFEMPSETIIYNSCSSNLGFGKQFVKVSQKTFNKIVDTGIDVSFQNKYIFSDKEVQGRNFYLFSKPFEFPFKVADLIFLMSSEKVYCFINPDEEIEDSIQKLGQENFFVNNCPEEGFSEIVKICFRDADFARDCNVKVRKNFGYVEKIGVNEKFYFEGDALMFAAIFSEKSIYECQVNRLMKRTESLALLYKDKTILNEKVGCGTGIAPDLILLANSAGSFENSVHLNFVKDIVDEVENKNEDNSLCRLW